MMNGLASSRNAAQAECRIKAGVHPMELYRALFYYAVKRLQKKACTIPEHTPIQMQPAQEVVPIDFCQLDTISGDNNTDNGSDTATAIRINCRSLSLEITNLASRSVIHETISSLESSSMVIPLM